MKKIAAVIVVIIFISVAFYVWQQKINQPQTREAAIRQAQEYEPDSNCIHMSTFAVHEATGAQYSFPSGCLPPGWERVQNYE